MIERSTPSLQPRRRTGAYQLFILLAILVAPGAQAQAADGPPRLNTTGMCEATVAAAPQDPRLEECVAAEQRALAYLQAAYPAVPPRVRDRCERLSRKRSMGFGSYAFIQGCLDLK